MMLQAGQVQTADQQSLLTYEQLRTWLQALNITDDGQLVISSESLGMLPSQLPYELLGPLVLAAVDGIIANNQQQLTQPEQQQATNAMQHKLTLHGGAAPPAQSEQRDCRLHHQQRGLQLVGIDLQQPVAAPLTTCMAAYSCLQQLSLQELNIDVCAAKALGSILHSGCSNFSSNGCSTGAAGCSLRSLTLDAVFMCDMAWQALCDGLAAGCELQTIRLLNCLQPASVPALAAALAGCQQLKELDVSYNSLGCVQSSTSSANADGSSSQTVAAADTAWSGLIEALQGCMQLQVLSAVRCSLGPNAAAAAAKLLRAKDCSLTQVNLAHCSSMGAAALSQVVAAAASCCSLQQLDLSSTSLTDAALKPLAQATGSSWISRGAAAGCRGLRRLALGGNCRLSAAAMGQLGRAMASAGQLPGLVELSLAGCASVGDEGAIALADTLAAGGASLRSLNLSGCELTDVAAAALAGLLAPAPVEAPAAAAARFRSPLKWRAAAAAVPTGVRVQLLELRLVDNQITSAGIKSLAKAVSSPSCLQLLDVSFNWVGPQGMQPLAEAAAAAAASNPASAATDCSQQQQQPPAHTLTVLRECLPEYWRVEAAKQAAAHAMAAEVDGEAAQAAGQGASKHSGSPAVGAMSLADSSSCSGSCRSQAGTAGSKALSLSQRGNGGDAAEPQQGEAPDKQLWMFNTLFCHEGGLSRTSSAIAAGVYDGSDDICNHYDDSDDALSDIDSSGSSPVAGGSNSGSPALLSSYHRAEMGAPRAEAALLSRDHHAVAAAAAGVGAAENVVQTVGPESSSGSMEDAPAALPGQPKQLRTADTLYTTTTFGVGPGSPRRDQVRASSGGGATCAALGAAQPAAAAAASVPAVCSPSSKLLPRLPASGSRQSSSSSSSDAGGSAGPAWSGAPGTAPTPGLKTLRTMRRRVSEPAAAGSMRISAPAGAAAAAAAAGSYSPARTNGSAAAVKLPSHKMRSMSDAAEGGCSPVRQVKAVASASLAVSRSRVTPGTESSGSENSTGSAAVAASSDSCALRDCVPTPGRRSALPLVSS
uniref:Uncharacterized protein n=1 Tax=Tetradesmus obliquus TaxID=3088 RepID=A0A383VZW8_TETOB|eukprot:jgi/Sobl393_1/2200/SZX70429.1